MFVLVKQVWKLYNMYVLNAYVIHKPYIYFAIVLGVIVLTVYIYIYDIQTVFTLYIYDMYNGKPFLVPLLRDHDPFSSQINIPIFFNESINSSTDVTSASNTSCKMSNKTSF